jgi:hypothetical protein
MPPDCAQSKALDGAFPLLAVFLQKFCGIAVLTALPGRHLDPAADKTHTFLAPTRFSLSVCRLGCRCIGTGFRERDLQYL